MKDPLQKNQMVYIIAHERIWWVRYLCPTVLSRKPSSDRFECVADGISWFGNDWWSFSEYWATREQAEEALMRREFEAQFERLG